MPSKIDIVARNRTVYASASPPTVDVGIFTIATTGIDLKNAGTTTLFTVPTGRTFMLIRNQAVVTAVNTGGGGTLTYQIKESGASNIMSAVIASGSVTPVVGRVYGEDALFNNAYTPFFVCTAGNAVQVVMSASNAGSTGVTGTLFTIGVYTS